jgi:hypothetical protein
MASGLHHSLALAFTLRALSDMAERKVFSRDKLPDLCQDRQRDIRVL